MEMLDADMALANRKAYEQKMVQFIAGALVRCLFARMNCVRGRSGPVRSGPVVRRRLCVVPLCAENVAQRVAGAPVPSTVVGGRGSAARSVANVVSRRLPTPLYACVSHVVWCTQTNGVP